MKQDALMVFAKYPEPGRVKTRLEPMLGAAGAAALYEAFILDSLARYATLGVDVILFVPPSLEAEKWSAGLPVDRVEPQEGNGLAERMANAFSRVFDEGYRQVVIIGTDHPTLPISYVRRAFSSLAGSDTVVIGPAEDGGYYLLGLNVPSPHLFDGMEYSHERVFDETIRRVGLQPAQTVLLPYWYDVDDRSSLERLCEDVSAAEKYLPETHAKLGDLGLLGTD